MRGRDVEQKETALIFAGGNWSILGEASEVRRSDERMTIIEALKDYGSAMGPADIAVATGKKSDHVRQLLFKMAKAGEVYKVRGGRYWLEPLDPHHTDNTDNTSDEGPENNE